MDFREKPKEQKLPQDQGLIAIDSIENKDGFYISTKVTDTMAATAANYGVFYTAFRPCEILWVAETHKTAGTDVGAVTLNLEILDSAEALDAGDTVLSTAFDLKSTADTPVMKSGTDLSSSRQMKEGQRLALKDSGALTSVADVVVTVYFKQLGKGHYR